MLELKLDLEGLCAELEKRKAKKVLLQLPEGLKTRSNEIVERLESYGITAMLFVEPSFGACDIRENEAKDLGCDVVVHFGHNRFYMENFPTVYWPVEYEFDEKKVAKETEKLAEFLGKKGLTKIGLCSAVQYAKTLPAIEGVLAKHGIKCFNEKGPRTQTGQVLGCNCSTVAFADEKVEANVFAGDGAFHPLMIVFASQKPVFGFSPSDGKITDYSGEREKFLRKRFASIARAQDAKIFGVLVSTKKGQNMIKVGEHAKMEIEKAGKKAVIIASDLVKEDYLAGLKLDALVDTACPRIALDGSHLFKRPIVTPLELEIVLGKKKFEDYLANPYY